jgi:hypothetical protein
LKSDLCGKCVAQLRANAKHLQDSAFLFVLNCSKIEDLSVATRRNQEEERKNERKGLTLTGLLMEDVMRLLAHHKA